MSQPANPSPTLSESDRPVLPTTDGQEPPPGETWVAPTLPAAEDAPPDPPAPALPSTTDATAPALPSTTDATAPSVPPLLAEAQLPRLAAAPTVTPGPQTTPPVAPLPGEMPSGLPDSGPALPTLPPTPPATAPATVTDPATAEADAPDAEQPAHPMADLMPTKAAATEASKRAAEFRAARKAKARKIKIGIVVGFLAVAAIVGPPLGKWLVDAINDAGSSPAEQPAQ